MQRARGSVSSPRPVTTNLLRRLAMTGDYSTTPITEREAFGRWLSGFTDGEGNFQIHQQSCKKDGKPRGEYYGSFKIGLRCDDRPILEEVMAYFGCGQIYHVTPSGARVRPGTNPQAHWMAYRLEHLVGQIIPHFEAFPLRAKKARDFVIWRQAVLHLHKINQRSAWGKSRRHGRVKWTEADSEYLARLKTALEEGRAFDLAFLPPPLPESPPEPQERGLFD